MVRLTIPARRAFVGLARQVMVEAARRESRLQPERLEDIRLIVSEAVTNAVQAHQRAAALHPHPGSPGSIDLSCDVEDGRVTIVVTDSAGGSDAPTDGPFDAPDSSVGRIGGYGLPIMDTLSDELSVRAVADGTMITVVISVEGPGPRAPGGTK